MKVSCCAACALAEAFASRVKALAKRRNPEPAVKTPAQRRGPDLSGWYDRRVPGAGSEPELIEGDAALLGRHYHGA